MATAKKSTATKRTTTRKTTATKKAAPRKVTPRKTTTKTTRKSPKKTQTYETFKLSTDVPPIMSFKITKQTIYWVIIMAFIIFFQLWIIKLQVEVAQIIDTQQTQLIQED